MPVNQQLTACTRAKSLVVYAHGPAHRFGRLACPRGGPAPALCSRSCGPLHPCTSPFRRQPRRNLCGFQPLTVAPTCAVRVERDAWSNAYTKERENDQSSTQVTLLLAMSLLLLCIPWTVEHPITLLGLFLLLLIPGVGALLRQSLLHMFTRRRENDSRTPGNVQRSPSRNSGRPFASLAPAAIPAVTSRPLPSDLGLNKYTGLHQNRAERREFVRSYSRDLYVSDLDFGVEETGYNYESAPLYQYSTQYRRPPAGQRPIVRQRGGLGQSGVSSNAVQERPYAVDFSSSLSPGAAQVGSRASVNGNSPQWVHQVKTVLPFMNNWGGFL